MINPFLTKPNYIRIFGHRGARGEIAENSIEGFKHTFALGIKAVEFDVVISKDKIPVLYHYFNLMPYLVKDENGNWLKNSELKVFDKNYEELSKYNIGGLDPESRHGKRFKEQKLLKNAKIPKLSELLELASRKENKDVFLNLEVKSTPFKMGLTPIPSDTVSLILKDIDTYKLEDRIIISSFDWRILYELKKQNPRILRGFITLQQDLSTTKKNIFRFTNFLNFFRVVSYNSINTILYHSNNILLSIYSPNASSKSMFMCKFNILFGNIAIECAPHMPF